jgi:RimJ/RimL family protein N-acetyltransferase
VKTIEPRTARLWLRQWREEDLPAMAALHADPRVMRYFPATLDREQSDLAVARFASHIREHGWGFWAVECRRSGDCLGLVGLAPIPDPLPFAPGVQIGWRLAADAWGQGYATEAARAALAVGFDTLGLVEILAYTAALNAPSRAVMQRLGMRCADEYFEHPRLDAASPLRRHCLYRLPRRDWLGGRGAPSAAGSP